MSTTICCIMEDPRQISEETRELVFMSYLK